MEKDAFFLRGARLLRQALQSPLKGTPRLMLPSSLYRSPEVLQSWEAGLRESLASRGKAWGDRLAAKAPAPTREVVRNVTQLGVEHPDAFLLSQLAYPLPIPGAQPALQVLLTEAKIPLGLATPTTRKSLHNLRALLNSAVHRIGPV